MLVSSGINVDQVGMMCKSCYLLYFTAHLQQLSFRFHSPVPIFISCLGAKSKSVQMDTSDNEDDERQHMDLNTSLGDDEITHPIDADTTFDAPTPPQVDDYPKTPVTGSRSPPRSWGSSARRSNRVSPQSADRSRVSFSEYDSMYNFPVSC